MHHPNCLEGLYRLLLLRGDRKCKTVNEHIFLRDSMLYCIIHDAFCQFEPGLCSLRDTSLVHRKSYNRRAVALNYRKDIGHYFRLCIDRVNYSSAVICSKPRLYGLRV